MEIGIRVKSTIIRSTDLVLNLKKTDINMWESFAMENTTGKASYMTKMGI